MLEWRPPDPRIVALIRRIQDAARHLGHVPGGAENFTARDEELAPDPESNHREREPTVPGADPPDHDPDD